jgi:hypothetical protein
VRSGTDWRKEWWVISDRWALVYNLATEELHLVSVEELPVVLPAGFSKFETTL